MTGVDQSSWAVLAGQTAQTNELGMPSKVGAYALFVQHGITQTNAGGQPHTTAPAAPVPAPPLPLVMLSNTYSQGALSLTLFASTPFAGRVIVYAARPALASNNLYKKGAFKVIGSLPSLVQGGNSISALYAAKYRVPSAGYEVAVKLVGVTSHGFRTSEMLLTNIVGASAQAAHEAADETVLKVA